MRSNQELAMDIVKRAGVIKQQRAARRGMVVVGAAGAISLALILVFSLQIAQVRNAMPDRQAVTGLLGAVFVRNEALGYVVIGIMAFLFGVGVSLLAFLVWRRSVRPDRDERP